NQTKGWQRDADTICVWGRLLPLLENELGPAKANADWEPILRSLNQIPILADVPQICDSVLLQLAVLQQKESPGCSAETLERLTRSLEQASNTAADLMARLRRLAANCNQLVEEMDFAFLFDNERKLFPIG